MLRDDVVDEVTDEARREDEDPTELVRKRHFSRDAKRAGGALVDFPVFDQDERQRIAFRDRDVMLFHERAPGVGLLRRELEVAARVVRDDELNRAATQVAHAVEEEHRAHSKRQAYSCRARRHERGDVARRARLHHEARHDQDEARELRDAVDDEAESRPILLARARRPQAEIDPWACDRNQQEAILLVRRRHGSHGRDAVTERQQDRSARDERRARGHGHLAPHDRLLRMHIGRDCDERNHGRCQKSACSRSHAMRKSDRRRRRRNRLRDLGARRCGRRRRVADGVRLVHALELAIERAAIEAEDLRGERLVAADGARARADVAALDLVHRRRARDGIVRVGRRSTRDGW